MGHAVIKPMEFVDDLADSNHNIQSTSASNQITEQIQHQKRLKFSARKCELLVICQVENKCNLQANNMPIKQFQHVKYLGDFIISQGNNCYLIKSRIDRSYGSVVTELISICKEAYFGSKQIEIMLLLNRSVYLPRLIYNCESWSKLIKNDIYELKKAQRRYLTLFDMGFFEPWVMGGMRTPHHSFVVIAPTIMKLGTGITFDVFYTMATKNLLHRYYYVIMTS